MIKVQNILIGVGKCALTIAVYAEIASWINYDEAEIDVDFLQDSGTKWRKFSTTVQNSSIHRSTCRGVLSKLISVHRNTWFKLLLTHWIVRFHRWNILTCMIFAHVYSLVRLERKRERETDQHHLRISRFNDFASQNQFLIRIHLFELHYHVA